MAASRASTLRNCNSSAAAFHQRLSLLWRSPNPQSAVASAAAAKPITIFNQELMSYEGRPSDYQSKPSFDPVFSLSSSVSAVCGVDVLGCQMGPPPGGLLAVARAPKKVVEEEEVSDLEEVDDDDDGDSDEDLCDDDSDEDFCDDFSDEDSCDDVSDEDDCKK